MIDEIHRILKEIGEDPSRDGLVKTPDRVDRSMRYLTSGYGKNADELLNGALFDVVYDEMVIVKNIEVFSLCEHHLLPFFGKCHVAYIPNGKIIGLSKIPRLVDMYARRLQVQERLTTQVADTINAKIQPKGVAVVIEAQHLCMIMRGVEKQNSIAVTSSMLGAFKDDQNTRNEFLRTWFIRNNMLSAVIFDLDGTLTRTPNPWRHIHECLGVWNDVASAHLEEWLSGKICYEEFCQKDTGLWDGLTVSEIHDHLDKIEVNPNVPRVVEALVRRGIPSIIISSGFGYVARKIQSTCKWEPLLVYANELVEGPDVEIRVSADHSSSLSKKAHADAALRIVGARMSETLVVSDAMRDLEQLCDCGFHLHVREEDDLLRTLHYLDCDTE